MIPPRSLLALTALTWLSAACAPIPRPSILAQAEQVSRGPAAAAARKDAPSAYARAEKLRRDAGAAFDREDLAGAQILAEQSIAAYAHAHALARIARAESSERAAAQAHAAAQTELATINDHQARVAAEIDALDMRIKVARDAQPIAPSGKADPEREKARLAAARALALQARMLCGAARLLLIPGNPADKGPPPDLTAKLTEATAAVEKLEADLGPPVATGPRPAPAGDAPIDAASRARAACLATLTAARRAATPISRAPGTGDALLAELSAAGKWSPSRDDRGIAITLRGLFAAGKALTPTGEARLRELAQVAAAHPAFPIAVVLHSAREPRPRDEPTWKARADAIVQILKAAHVARVEPLLAGARAPVVDPAGSERSRNARVEIIFITPETL